MERDWFTVRIGGFILCGGLKYTSEHVCLLTLCVHTSISKYTLSDRAADQLAGQICSHVRECAIHFSFYFTLCNLKSWTLLSLFALCFYCIDSGLCYFTKPITFPLWRKNFELDEETIAGLCWCFLVKWINKTRNVDEEELGFGHIHKTGSVALWQIQHWISLGKNISMSLKARCQAGK